MVSLAMGPVETIVHRRYVRRSNEDGDLSSGDHKAEAPEEEESQESSIKSELSLMEQLLLLGLKDKAGYLTFWNGSLCLALRGGILVELALRGRIKLEDAGMKKKSLSRRKVLLKNGTPTGECFLDEALKHIKDSRSPENVSNWISYLSGDSWNFLKKGYHMRNLRERVAKGLVEKGVLSTEKVSFLIFEMTMHPLLDSDVKSQLVKKVQEGFLSRWVNDFSRMDSRLLALLLLAQVSDAVDNALCPLSNDDFALAIKRAGELSSLDPEYEAQKENSVDVLWAVFDHLSG